MKEKLVTEITILPLSVPVVVECEEGYDLTAEQLAWVEELAMKKLAMEDPAMKDPAMKEYLSQPLSERIKKMEAIINAEAWKKKDAFIKLEKLEEEYLTYSAIVSDLYGEEIKWEFSTTNQYLIDDDCG